MFDLVEEEGILNFILLEGGGDRGGKDRGLFVW